MPRPAGSKNKKTLEREALERARLGPVLLGPQPFQPPAQIGLRPSGKSEDGGQRTEEEPLPIAPGAPAGDFIEYLAPSGEHWRIENGRAMVVAFHLELADVTRWHEALAPQAEAWHVLRAHYGIAPLVGESNPEYLRPRGLGEIAAALGLNESIVGGQIESAKAYWVRWRVTNAPDEKKAISMAPALPVAERDELLRRYGFGDLTEEEQKIFVAQRLNDFKHKLEDDEGSTLPPQSIRLELQLRSIDKILLELDKTATTSPTTRDEMKSWMTMREKVSSQHLNLMEAMNATQAQNPSVQRKVAFIDSLGALVKAQQEYEARGDTELIDGLHTAAEIKFLITPTTLRPAQYRPDLLPLLQDALRHENLWNPDYVPPTLERGQHRRLLKAFQEGVQASAREDGGIPEMEEEEEGGGGGGQRSEVGGQIAAPMDRPPVMPAPLSMVKSSGPRPGEGIVT